MAPVKLDISGDGRITRRSDRAIVRITVKHKGLDEKQVTETVQRATKEVQDRIEPLARRAPDGAVTADTAVLRWSKDAPVTSKYEVRVDNDFDDERVIYEPVRIVRERVSIQRRDARGHHNRSVGESESEDRDAYSVPERRRGEGQRKYRQMHSATVALKVWFGDFEKLGQFTDEVAEIPRVEIAEVKWVMSEKMESGLRAEAMKTAYNDALTKATAYSQALRRSKINPVQIRDDPGRIDRSGEWPYESEYIVTRDGALEKGKPLKLVPRDVTYIAACNVIFEVE